MFSERITKIAFSFLVFVAILGLFGPTITPYEYDARQYDGNELEQLESPSWKHPLGTTQGGYDVLSRLIYGARATLITGFVGGFIIITLGSFVGITAGYFGGLVELVLMRFTDFVYGVPLIPFAIVLVGFFGLGFWSVILIIGLVLWRGSARVLRSQVLQIKNREYIKAAKTTGAGPGRIIFRHIFPNVLGMAVLYFAIGVGGAIIYQAGLAFIGVSNPFIPSWGVMLRNAYNTGLMSEIWWWSVPPGIMISATVLSTYMVGRGYEALSEQSSYD